MGKALLHSVMRAPMHAAGKSSERKKLLKMCVRKLQSIDDPETFLCRSVLINNTLKTLRTMQRESKLKKEAIRRRAAYIQEQISLQEASQHQEEGEEELEVDREREEEEGEEEGERVVGETFHEEEGEEDMDMEKVEERLPSDEECEEEEEEQEEEEEEDTTDVMDRDEHDDNDDDDYQSVDILTNIEMPLPLSPTLEDLSPLTPVTASAVEVTSLSTAVTSAEYTLLPTKPTTTTTHYSMAASPLLSSTSPLLSSASPLLSSNSSLSSGWLDREALDWGEITTSTSSNSTTTPPLSHSHSSTDLSQDDSSLSHSTTDQSQNMSPTDLSQNVSPTDLSQDLSSTALNLSQDGSRMSLPATSDVPEEADPLGEHPLEEHPHHVVVKVVEDNTSSHPSIHTSLQNHHTHRRSSSPEEQDVQVSWSRTSEEGSILSEESILWERSKEDVTATLDLTLIHQQQNNHDEPDIEDPRDFEEETSECSACSETSSSEGSNGSEADLYEEHRTSHHTASMKSPSDAKSVRETGTEGEEGQAVSCSNSYIAETQGSGSNNMCVINSLIATMES